MQNRVSFEDGAANAVDAGWDTADANARGQGSVRAAAETRARALGYFSLALGAAQLTLPGPLASLIGLRNCPSSRAALRAIGLREITSGIGLLTHSGSPTFAWLRFAGDVVDLALLGRAATSRTVSHGRLAAAAAGVAAVAALDAISANQLGQADTEDERSGSIEVVRSITINRSPEAVYDFWRQLENLPQFMAHLESVTETGGISTWRAKSLADQIVEWQAEITVDRRGEVIAWKSLEGATVPNCGVVRFKPALLGRATEVSVELQYDPPGGALTAAVAKLVGKEPSQQIAGDLRRLKQVLETGGVMHSDASIHAGAHPARPAAANEQVTVLGANGGES